MDVCVKDFLVFIIELSAESLFDNNKPLAYTELKNAGVLDYYAETYDVSHTLGSEYLLNEIKTLLNKNK